MPSARRAARRLVPRLLVWPTEHQPTVWRVADDAITAIVAFLGRVDVRVEFPRPGMDIYEASIGRVACASSL